MIEISVTIGADAYERGRFLYVWLNGRHSPIYVGETSRSVADRIGLHVRDKDRSGAVVAKHYLSMSPGEKYTILAFPIDNDLLNRVAVENGAKGHSAADQNRAQKAIERYVYDVLSKVFSDIHVARGCKWTRARCAHPFAEEILQQCKDRTPRDAA